jgi:hypothetical protein
MPTYRVKWTIDIDADSAKEAAVRALRIQRDTDSTATVFDVSTTVETTKTIDVSCKPEFVKFGYKG